MFKWKHSKHSKYSKILVTIVYSDQIETEKHFLKTSQQSRIYGKNFRSIVSLLQKTVSTSSLKNLQKTEKCSFQTRRTFAFELEVASKPFSKMLPLNNDLESFLSLSWNTIWTSSLKNLQKWKMLIWNAQNI